MLWRICEDRSWRTMATTLLLLFSLLLATPVTPSHFIGGRSTFKYGGRNPDGTHKVLIRNKATYDGCRSQHWNCRTGNCGTQTSSQRATIDSSNNAPVRNREWCESETMITRNVPSDKPFSLRASSCCWIQTKFGVGNWRLSSTVDLAQRSDTNRPNSSPDVAILPFLRVPQNCPRTYKLGTVDPDGDDVRCRYGNIRSVECSSCINYAGFTLDQNSCTLSYVRTASSTRVYAFETVVEDFPKESVTLRYSDGSSQRRNPLPRSRVRRSSWITTQITTTSPPPTTPHNLWYWWMIHHVTTPPTTTQTTTRPPPTTPHNLWYWWMIHHVTTPPTTTQTTQVTTTRPPPTMPHNPWYWWMIHHVTTPPTTTQTTQVTTTRPPPTTTQSPWNRRPSTVYSQPLSKGPLQFSVLVDPPVSSCHEGHYIPKLVSPTPRNGAEISAECDRVLEIKVKAYSIYSTLDDIIYSGPPGITKHRTTHQEFVLRWKPTEKDLGMKFPLCFAVESSDSLSFQTTTMSFRFINPYNPPYSSTPRIYQSEMRCVTIGVLEPSVVSEVSCGQSTMSVSIEKASLRGLHENNLRLSDPANVVCSLQTYSNNTHVVASFPLNACGTQIEEDEEKLIFKNEITSVDNTMSLITRKHLLELDFYCEYPKHGNVTLGFKTHRKNVTVWEKGFGRFTYGFEFYINSNYRDIISPSLYPVECAVGTPIFMQIEATTAVNNTELFVESCRASPYDNPNYRPTYSIIEQGCAVDPTVRIHTAAHPNQFRFSMETFKFIGLHDQVYISCSVIICERGSWGTRCSRGCIPPTMAGLDRRKREVGLQSKNHFISQGPLRLKRSPELTTSTDEQLNLNLNLNVVFIVGALLAAVAMISTVSYMKKRISTVKYQTLPTSEN